MSDLQAIRNSFDRIAERYENHAALEQEVCTRLLEKTSFNRLAPETILDLGCGTGFGAARLKQSFRKARVIGMDASMGMLAQLRRRSSLLRPLKGVCGDLIALPFATRSVDMLVANLSNYWCSEPMAMFAEYRRVLRPDGMLVFSTFGPRVLEELRAAWHSVDPAVQLPEFPDLLEIGDALVTAGFRESVMDMEVITLQYPDLQSMLKELEATGTSLLIRGWKNEYETGSVLDQAYAPFLKDSKYPLSFEIIYGVAFGPQEGQPVKTPTGDVATFSVESLKRSRKVS